MPGEVLPDYSGAVGDLRVKQQVRAPDVTAGDDELLRVNLDRLVRAIAIERDRVADALRRWVEHELADDGARHETNAIRRAQRTPGEIGRILRPDRTDRIARGVATGRRASIA